MLGMQFILLQAMLRCKSCLKMIETSKAESKDATQDKVEVFNEDTCNVYLVFCTERSAYAALKMMGLYLKG